MPVEKIWIVILAVATPLAGVVGGVVGFAINILMVKKTRLENEKLKLELEALRKAQQARDSQIVRATPDEIGMVARAQRHYTRDSAPPMKDPTRRTSRTNFHSSAGWLFSLALLVAYLLWKHFIR